jgi:hypothetical protein
MEQRKDSRIRRLLQKEELQDQGDKIMEQREDSRIRPLMHKKNETEKRFQDQLEMRQKDSRIRGTKEWSREKIPGLRGSCCGKKDFRIRGTKEWSSEKIQGSAGRCKKKNKTKRMKQRKDCPVVPCWAV